MHKLCLPILLFLTLCSGTTFAASKQLCTNPGTQINAQQMTASRSFESSGPANTGWGLASVHVDLTDADTSITSLAMSCVGKYYSESSEYILQSCATASGVCTSSDASWTKASPGTKKWVWRVDIEGIQSFKCTFSVGSGTGASADLLTAKLRLCTKGN